MSLRSSAGWLAAALGLSAASPAIDPRIAQQLARQHVAKKPKRDWRRDRWAPPGGGVAERARRRAQIARGYLTVSNGLLRNAEDLS